MNATKTLTSLALITIPTVGFIARGDSVSFKPEDGTVVEKTLSLESSFYMDDMSIVLDGGEISPDMMGGGMDEALIVNVNMGVTDEYLSTRDGGIGSLKRTYDELSFEAGGESSAENVDQFATMKGVTVKFTWDAESDDFVKTFDDSEGEEEWLENLDPDMDLLQLLPDGEVSVGDTWEATGEGLLTVFSPGGMLSAGSEQETSPEAEELVELAKEQMTSQLESVLEEFAIKCTYTGTQKEDDAELGAIEIEFAGEAELDLSELILSAIELNAEQMGGIEADLTAIVTLELEGTGVLLWDMKAGHASSFSMKYEIIVGVDLDGEVDAMGENHTFEVAVELSGEANMELETGSADEDDE
jgi:hypothetical protein